MRLLHLAPLATVLLLQYSSHNVLARPSQAGPIALTSGELSDRGAEERVGESVGCFAGICNYFRSKSKSSLARPPPLTDVDLDAEAQRTAEEQAIIEAGKEAHTRLLLGDYIDSNERIGLEQKLQQWDSLVARHNAAAQPVLTKKEIKAAEDARRAQDRASKRAREQAEKDAKKEAKRVADAEKAEAKRVGKFEQEKKKVAEKAAKEGRKEAERIAKLDKTAETRGLKAAESLAKPKSRSEKEIQRLESDVNFMHNMRARRRVLGPHPYADPNKYTESEKEDYAAYEDAQSRVLAQKQKPKASKSTSIFRARLRPSPPQPQQSAIQAEEDLADDRNAPQEERSQIQGDADEAAAIPGPSQAAKESLSGRKHFLLDQMRRQAQFSDAPFSLHDSSPEYHAARSVQRERPRESASRSQGTSVPSLEERRTAAIAAEQAERYRAFKAQKDKRKRLEKLWKDLEYAHMTPAEKAAADAREGQRLRDAAAALERQKAHQRREEEEKQERLRLAAEAAEERAARRHAQQAVGPWFDPSEATPVNENDRPLPALVVAHGVAGGRGRENVMRRLWRNIKQ